MALASVVRSEGLSWMQKRDNPLHCGLDAEGLSFHVLPGAGQGTADPGIEFLHGTTTLAFKVLITREEDGDFYC